MKSKEAKNLSKQDTGNTSDLVIALTDKDTPGKRKIASENKYYNCHKFGHFKRDSFLSDRKVNRNTQQF